MTSLHRRLIEHYVALVPGTQSTGFRSFVAGLEKRVELDEAISPPRFTPDAFRVDEESREVWLVEAEVTSRIAAAKWALIAAFREAIVEYGDWDTWVHVIDRTGAVFSVETPMLRGLGADEVREFALNPPGRHVWIPGAANQPTWRASEWRRAHWMSVEDQRACGLHDVVAANARSDAEWALRSPFSGVPLFPAREVRR